MVELNDKELVRVRLRFLDLAKSFFVSEPCAERIGRWRGIFTALSSEMINPELDAATREIAVKLNENSLEELKNEYYQLFVDPFSDKLVSLEASFYNEGRSYGKTLIDFRGLLGELKLQKDDDFKMPEDSLVFILDVLARLIEAEGDEDSDTKHQQEIVEHYLYPLSSEMKKNLESHDSADFYAACARFLHGYIELEKGLLV